MLLMQIFDRFRKWWIKSSAGRQLRSEALAHEVFRIRGNEFIAAGDLLEAEHCFRSALEKFPSDTKSLECLGYVLKEQGRLAESAETLLRVLAISDNSANRYETHYLLGEVYKLQGAFSDAASHLRASLRLNQEFVLACKALCEIYRQSGDEKAIRDLLEECVKGRPNCLDYRIFLAEICLRELDFEGGALHLSVAVRLGAATAETYMMLGAALCRVGRVTEGAGHMAAAEALNPKLAVTSHYELGCHFLNAGDPKLGMEHMEQAVALDPDYLAAHSALLMTLSYAENRSEADYRKAAERFSAAVTRQVELSPSLGGDSGVLTRDGAAGKLRVGFVSGDLIEHPVTFFLNDVIKHLDRRRIRVIAYSDNVIQHEVTQTLREQFDEWHEINHLSDAAVAELIRANKIEVLIDLAGHTGGNRLSLFARRPAPVQATWLGYWASTGLKEMDFILADSVSVPVNSPEWFSEKVYRLPETRLCMSIPKTARPIFVGPVPCAKNGILTFGSFQQIFKMTPRVLKVWAQIMRAVPGSRLRLQTYGMDIPLIREKFSQTLVAAGIDLERTSLLGTVDKDCYLEAHNEIDILLDTFPYPGGTTTAFALWMGVPTISMTGETMISRQGITMLHCAGLEDWIANSEEQYIEIAKRMSLNQMTLKDLRSTLRSRVEASSLFNAKRFSEDFQTALFDMSRYDRCSDGQGAS